MSRKKEKLAMIDAEIARVQRELGHNFIWNDPKTKTEEYKNKYVVPALEVLQKEECKYDGLNIVTSDDASLRPIIISDGTSVTKPDEVLIFHITDPNGKRAFMQILVYTSVGGETKTLLHCGMTDIHTRAAYDTIEKAEHNVNILVAKIKSLLNEVFNPDGYTGV